MTSVRLSLERFARPAWLLYAIVGGVFAVWAITRWVWAVSLDGPVIYSEGAVAHAAVLARDGIEYTAVAMGEALFVAANYTPLYFHLVSAGDPFVIGRVISIVSALFIAGSIAWRARHGGPVVAAGLALGWIALAPVVIWGPTVKPDLLALALAVASVLFLERSRRFVVVGAVLMVLAVMTKPTAALPAMAIALWFLLVGRRTELALYAGVGALGALVLVVFASGGPAGLLQHVVTWNELDWSLEHAALLAVLAVLLIGITVVAALTQGPRGATGAHLAGALAVIALGGRDGATVNYLLDASAAGAIVLATVAPQLRLSSLLPLTLSAQLVLGLALLDPLGLGRGLLGGTGAWSSPDRFAVVGALPEGDLLVEDSGLIIVVGRQPLVDDLFLWSRLVERGTIDPAPVLDHVREGRFVRIVSEVDLSRLESAPTYRRHRWAPPLAEAVLDNYALVATEAGLFVYQPR